MGTQTATAFDGMADDLAFDDTPAQPEFLQQRGGWMDGQYFVAKRNATKETLAEESKLFVEECSKCAGTGMYRGLSRHGYQCFACSGKGSRTYRTSAEDRARARAAAAIRKERAAATATAEEAFAQAQPEAHAWMLARAENFGFAASMLQAVRQYGHLTEKQLASVLRCVEGDKARAAQRAEAAKVRAETAPQVNVSTLVASFEQAAKTLKFPRLRFDGFSVTRAGENSKNPGALYVKSDDGVYLGKVADGKFWSSRDCGADVQAQVVELLQDPAAAVRAYGLRTGRCCLCARELTDKESVTRGVGPICAEKWGF